MKRIYPWEEWFRQRQVTLLRGRDYDCSQSTMSQTIRNNASARDLRVRLQDTGSGFVVEVVGPSRGKRLYPWDDWFRMGYLVLHQGVHYHCSQSAMVQMLRNASSVRGLRTQLTDMGTTIVVRVVSPAVGAHVEIPHTDQAPVSG